MTATRASSTSALRPSGRPSHGWQISCGVLLIVLGFLAVLMPAVAALATAIVFAWLLILSGGFEVAHAIQTRAERGFGWKLTSGLLTLVLGIALLVMPVAGVASLALLVGGVLVLSGVARLMLAWRMRPSRGWGWVMFDGLLSVALAVLIVVGWPGSSLAIIGLLTGFTLISSGVWRLVMARLGST